MVTSEPLSKVTGRRNHMQSNITFGWPPDTQQALQFRGRTFDQILVTTHPHTRPHRAFSKSNQDQIEFAEKDEKKSLTYHSKIDKRIFRRTVSIVDSTPKDGLVGRLAHILQRQESFGQFETQSLRVGQVFETTSSGTRTMFVVAICARTVVVGVVARRKRGGWTWSCTSCTSDDQTGGHRSKVHRVDRHFTVRTIPEQQGDRSLLRYITRQSRNLTLHCVYVVLGVAWNREKGKKLVVA